MASGIKGPIEQYALIEVEQWEDLAEELNCTDMDNTRAQRGPRGWQTKVITPALDHDGQPSQIAIGTVLTEDGQLLIAIRVGASEHIANVEQVRGRQVQLLSQVRQMTGHWWPPSPN